MPHVQIDKFTWTDNLGNPVNKPIGNNIEVALTVQVAGQNFGHTDPTADGHAIAVIMHGTTAGGFDDDRFALTIQNGTEAWNTQNLTFDGGAYNVMAICLAEQDSDGPYGPIKPKANPQFLIVNSVKSGKAAAQSAPPVAAPGRLLLIAYPFLGFGKNVSKPVAFSGFVSAGETLFVHLYHKGPPTYYQGGVAKVLGNFWYVDFGKAVPPGPARMIVHTDDLALKMSIDVNVV